MSCALNQEIMKKSFMMGDDGNRFTHNAAKKIKLFPFVTNNNALIIRTLSSVIGEWLRIVRPCHVSTQLHDSTYRGGTDRKLPKKKEM